MLANLDLASLGQLQVYTASRFITNTTETAAVTSIITAEDIQNRGYRSLYEVMQHIPGAYYNTTSHFENLTSRGLAQALSSYLLLIDGHAINDKSSFGISAETVFPTLSNVQRIEVVRGAGSVLWGSEAGIGIIHIITKSAQQLDPTGEGAWQIALDYETEHKRDLESAIYAKDLAEGGYTVSISRFDSDAPQADVYGTGATGVALIDLRKRANMNLEPGYDIYFKGHWRDYGLKASFNNARNNNFHSGSDNEAIYQRNWIELSYNPELTDQTRIENKIYLNDYKVEYQFNDHFKFSNTYDLTRMQGYGVESLIFHEADNYHLTSGIKIDSHRMTLKAPYNIPNPGPFLPYEQISPVTDKTYALFSELNYSLQPDFHITLGARYQKNDGILDTDFITPRFATIYNVNEESTLKYIFNGSEVAPSLRTWLGGRKGSLYQNGRYSGGAEESQKYQAHEIQYQFNTDNTFLSAGLFYMRIDDLIHYYGQGVTVDGDTVIKTWGNGPGASTRGLELEFKQAFDRVELYGNYTYAKATYDEGSWTLEGNTTDFVDGFFRHVIDSDLNIVVTPEHMWNLGADINLTNNMLLNIHYNGYANVAYDQFNTVGAPVDIGSEHFLDTTLVARDAFTQGLDLSFYLKNLFNNEAIVPDDVYGGYSESNMARRFGVNMTYSF
ncbi:ligand-gated channel [Amphritea balenae]|nr:ligand-gated channel [Amphritea balenae]